MRTVSQCPSPEKERPIPLPAKDREPPGPLKVVTGVQNVCVEAFSRL